MKKRSTAVFSRIGLLIFVIVSALSILFIVVTYMATTDYYQSSTQILNKEVAAHIAKFSSPYSPGGLDKKKADSVFYNAMIMSPNVEVYFLDTTGKVIYYHSADSLIKTWQVPLKNIRAYLKSPTTEIKNTDPKDPANPKIFSAAEVWNSKRMTGYIYVILVSKQYRNVAEIVFKSEAGGLAVKTFCIVILTTLFFSLLYTSRLQTRFNKVVSVLDRFKDGDLNVRFNMGARDEFHPISEAFNKMASMLESNFTKQKDLENERRKFLVNISHDLRTPLAVARGYAETLLIEKEKSSGRESAYLELMTGKIQMVEKLVLQLFELSNMESVNFVPVKEPFIFSEILLEVIAGAELQAKQKNITINCVNCEYPAYIIADARMMERVVQNLLENAVKYTDSGGNISINLSEESHQIIISFTNTGPMLLPKLVDWINTDGDVLVNRPAQTGLGLALIKQILKLHDFSIVAGVTANENYFLLKLDRYYPA